MTSVVLSAFAVGAPGTGGGGPAQALVPTADFRFVSPQRIWDSRNPGFDVPSGVEITLPPGAGRRVVDVGLAGGTQPSWLYFHPCGVPVDRTKPAAAFVEAAEIEANLAPIDAAQGCMTRFGDSIVLLDLVGVQDGTPGLDYVAHPTPTTIDIVPATTINVPVRDASVPVGAEAVAIWVGMFASQNSVGYVSLCGDASIAQRTVVGTPGGFGDNLFIAPIDASGNVCLEVTGNGALPESMYVRRYGYLQTGVTPSAEGLPYSGWVEQEAPGYVALSPSRLFDTRDNGGPPLAAGQIRRYQFTGLPATATAAALNITATETTGPGYVSAYPCDAGTPPEVSNVNFTGAGQTVPNFAVVSLGSTQELCFFTLSTTHLLVDVAGYFVWESGDGYVPTTPTRVFDSRSGPRLAAGATLTVDLTGRIGDATAVALNVAATQTTGDGFLTVYPCGQDVPTASNVNFRANQTRPNLVVVKVPADRRICVYSPTATHVFGDIAGWFSPSSNIGMFDGEPFRTIDTREPAGSPPLGSGEDIGFTFGYRYLRAMAWNLTVTQTGGPGFVTGYPCASGLPTTSNVNYSAANETVASFSFLPLDPSLELCFYALTRTHLLADEAGYFVVPVPFEVFYDGAPARIGPFT